MKRRGCSAKNKPITLERLDCPGQVNKNEPEHVILCGHVRSSGTCEKKEKKQLLLQSLDMRRPGGGNLTHVVYLFGLRCKESGSSGTSDFGVDLFGFTVAPPQPRSQINPLILVSAGSYETQHCSTTQTLQNYQSCWVLRHMRLANFRGDICSHQPALVSA